jgi:large subunit ribosomal protein L29
LEKIDMKAHEIRQLSIEELKKRVQDEETNLSHLKFQLATRQLTSPIQVRISRRLVAKLKTILLEKASQAIAK